MDYLTHLSRKQGAAEAVRQAILLLFYASLDAALLDSDLRQHIPHQACVNAPIPEVNFAVDPCPDIHCFRERCSR